MHNPSKLAVILAASFGVAGIETAAAPGPVAPSGAAAKPAGPSDKSQIEARERIFIAGFNAKNVD